MKTEIAKLKEEFNRELVLHVKTLTEEFDAKINKLKESLAPVEEKEWPQQNDEIIYASGGKSIYVETFQSDVIRKKCGLVFKTEEDRLHAIEWMKVDFRLRKKIAEVNKRGKYPETNNLYQISINKEGTMYPLDTTNFNVTPEDYLILGVPRTHEVIWAIGTTDLAIWFKGRRA